MMPKMPFDNEALNSIKRINGVQDYIVTGLDGIPLGQIDENSSIMSATTIAALGAIKEMMKRIEYGHLEQLMVETDYGKIIIEEIGDKYALIILAESNANIGMIRVVLKKIIKSFEDNNGRKAA